MRRSILTAVAASSAFLVAPAAHAADANNALKALRYLNLTVLENLESSSHMQGRTYVGGNLSGNGTVFYQSGNSIAAIPGSDTAWTGLGALTVGGSVSGSFSGHKVENGGNVSVLGNASGFGFNGASVVKIGGDFKNSSVGNAKVTYGGTQSGNANIGSSGSVAPGGTVTLAAGTNSLAADFTALSQQLRLLPAGNNSYTDVQNVYHGFKVTNITDGVATFNVTSAVLGASPFGSNDLQFDFGGADTVVINVSGKNLVLNTGFNDGAGGNNVAKKVIWNFYEADTISMNKQFYGSILAPLASVTDNGQNLTGSLVFKSFVQTAEVHVDTYSGNLRLQSAVPESSTWAMLIAGFGLIGGVLRRRAIQVAAV